MQNILNECLGLIFLLNILSAFGTLLFMISYLIVVEKKHVTQWSNSFLQLYATKAEIFQMLDTNNTFIGGFLLHM